MRPALQIAYACICAYGTSTLRPRPTLSRAPTRTPDGRQWILYVAPVHGWQVTWAVPTMACAVIASVIISVLVFAVLFARLVGCPVGHACVRAVWRAGGQVARRLAGWSCFFKLAAVMHVYLPVASKHLSASRLTTHWGSRRAWGTTTHGVVGGLQAAAVRVCSAAVAPPPSAPFAPPF